jgi:hypothetical protein
MLIDTRKQPIENNEGFNPNVQNQQIYAKARTGQKIALILFCVFTLGIYYFVVISKKN